MTDSMWVVSRQGRCLLITTGSAAWEHVLRSGDWQECPRPQPGKAWPAFDPARPPLRWGPEAEQLKRATVREVGLTRTRRTRPAVVPGGPPKGKAGG
jgi:hypothetical protein